MKNVLIFCGANKGFSADYEKASVALVQQLVASGANIITGGGMVGLMGVVADATIAAGGTITGVIPGFLNILEVAHPGLTEMIETETMHERKAIMHERCDAIIALPGGYGTFDELFETLTWAQLDQHQKPVGLLNVNGFYDHLLAFLDHIVIEGMLKSANRELLLADTSAEGLVAQMQRFEPRYEPKWL